MSVVAEKTGIRAEASAPAEKVEITPEDLLAMPDGKDYELVDGRLVERNMGSISSWIGGEIFFLIRSYLKEHPIGLLWVADNGFQCFPDKPGKVRKPDVSFIKHGRLPGDRMPRGYVRIRPDLAVEVVSPNDLAAEVDEKLHEYLKAGVPLVWVVNPDVRIVRVHRADLSGAFLTENDELSGEDVLPGFRCRVSDLFPPPERNL
jgi:Uma2 family endonuclease